MNVYLTQSRFTYSTHVELLDDVLFPQKVHWFPETYHKVTTGMFYPPHKVAEKVLDPDLMADLRENSAGKTAFILAAGNTNFSGISPHNKKPSRLSYAYKFLPLTLTQVYAARVAQACGASDQIITDSSACASSLKVLMDVSNLIQNYGFDRVIVLAVEDQVSNSVLEFFGETRAALLHEEESKTGTVPSAFDSKNYGFYVGQGAAFAVFDSEQTVERSGIDPIARLMGAYSASEVINNAIGQREDGQGFAQAIKGAAYYADINVEDIRTVKTHGTGTQSNNASESAGLRSVLKDFIATAYKPRIGHTMGVSGLLETLLLFEDMKTGFVPGIPNRSEEDAVFLSAHAPVPDGLVLSVAAGMGNIYSAAIFDRPCR